MSRAQRSARLAQLGLIPVVRARSPDAAASLGRALVAGGVRCLEITFTVPSAAQVIQNLREELGDGALVGAGTVTSAAQAQEAIAAGAEFLVSPGCIPELVAMGHAAEAPVLLGALTPTEIIAADRAGADFIKLFPANALGGASYLKAIRGPFPTLRFVPTGGVTLQNLGTFLEAGAVALGIGTALADSDLLEKSGASAVTELAARYQAEFSTARARLH